MSTIGCRIFAKLSRSRLNGLPLRIIAARRSNSTTESAESERIIVPAPQQGKIQAALLKEFSSPLVIENLDPPKRTQENEVSIKID